MRYRSIEDDDDDLPVSMLVDGLLREKDDVEEDEAFFGGREGEGVVSGGSTGGDLAESVNEATEGIEKEDDDDVNLDGQEEGEDPLAGIEDDEGGD